MRDLILGIDIGTTGVKAIVVDKSGNVLVETSRRCDLLSPKPGYAEEDPNVWWKNVLDILKGISELGKRIAAVGVSGMVPTLILIDEAGNPVRNSIQQNDARSVEEIKYFKSILNEDDYFSLTGNTINQQVIFPKFLWLKKNEPDNVKKTRWIMGSYNFINFKLTGIPNLETNWALESGLWKIKEKEWYKEVLRASGIDETLLPKVYEPWDIVGNITREVEELTGFPSGIPVIGGSADHIASTLATGLLKDGDLLLKFGGAGDIMYVSKDLKLSKKLFIDYHDIPLLFVLNGCMASSGSIVKWFKENFSNESYDLLTEKAKEVDIGSKGLILLPYFIGEKTPIFDPMARGVLFGLSLFHSKYHVFRAILEAVAYGFRHHIEVIRDEGLKIKRVFMSNGGAKNELWRQIVADVIGMDAVYIKDHPGSSLGVAFISGKTVEIFQRWEEIENFIRNRIKVNHDPKRHKIYSKYYSLYREIYEKLKGSFKKLHVILEGST